MESIDEKLSQLTSAYNKMANHVNGMDTNCENMWVKMKTMEQAMAYMMEQLECVTKHVSDLNVSMKLRDEEEREKAEANKNREAPRARVTNTVMENRCYRCDHSGHKSLDCPLKEQNKWFCYKCQSVQNHIAAKCPNHRYVDDNKN
ncbi:unnamed protein product [Trichogramma brassicae]|uniref:CCHC-type domain-containing protein n=1 Tax=Trichogramma brassicae TaxID=86971 RepID=A0A6H5IRR6_9HYME|nr:unnamed protein product [Trichogramma brassicae]